MRMRRLQSLLSAAGGDASRFAQAVPERKIAASVAREARAVRVSGRCVRYIMSLLLWAAPDLRVRPPTELVELSKQIASWIRRSRRWHHSRYQGAAFFTFMRSSAARSPALRFVAVSLAQKCMKKSLGASSSMWLCTAVTEMW